MELKAYNNSIILSEEELKVFRTSLDNALEMYSKSEKTLDKIDVAKIVAEQVDGKIDKDRLYTFLFSSHISNYVRRMSDYMESVKGIMDDDIKDEEVEGFV